LQSLLVPLSQVLVLVLVLVGERLERVLVQLERVLVQLQLEVRQRPQVLEYHLSVSLATSVAFLASTRKHRQVWFARLDSY
jgi:hypothetical protein